MQQLTGSMGLPQLWIFIVFTPGHGTGMLWERGDRLWELPHPRTSRNGWARMLEEGRGMHSMKAVQGN